jgi:hypothetical protein
VTSANDLQELIDLIAAAERASSDLDVGIERAKRRLGTGVVPQPEEQTSLALAHAPRYLSFTGSIDFRNGTPDSNFGTFNLKSLNSNFNALSLQAMETMRFGHSTDQTSRTLHLL